MVSVVGNQAPADGCCARIQEGLLGLANVCWSLDGSHLLTWSDYQLRLTIWPLSDRSVGSVYALRFPKYADRGFAFRLDGRYFAYAERVEGKDWVGVVDCRDWKLIKVLTFMLLILLLNRLFLYYIYIHVYLYNIYMMA
jgi:hypothetical protein